MVGTKYNTKGSTDKLQDRFITAFEIITAWTWA